MEKSSENKVLRKPDPTKRKNIHVVTLEKVRKFLKAQKDPVFKSDIVKSIGVDYNSLTLALGMLPIKYEGDGRFSIKKRK